MTTWAVGDHAVVVPVKDQEYSIYISVGLNGYQMHAFLTAKVRL